MYPLVETIRIKNGVPQNLKWHQERYERSCRTFLEADPKFILEDKINVPSSLTEGTVKCRFLYNKDSVKTEFHNYKTPRILSLKIVEDDTIEYSHKFTDRTSINNLLKMKEECDDILIIKNEFITDTSIANIVFFDGKNWMTPAGPLLNGTARARLLNEGKITAAIIMMEDLRKFSHFRLINAMLEFEEQEMIGISGLK